jgi:hypothetical protein
MSPNPLTSPRVFRLFVVMVLFLVSVPAYSQYRRSGPIVINGGSGIVIEKVQVTSTTGDCITIVNATNITIKNSEIGPCSGNGIKIVTGSGISVYDSYIHPEGPLVGCCDHTDGIFAQGVQGLYIQGNVIAYGEANIEVQASSAVSVRGNYLLNPRNAGSRGQQFQSWNSSTNVIVDQNYTVASQDTRYKFPANQTDALNTGVSTYVTFSNNYVTGGNNPFGCGILADYAADYTNMLHNSLVDTGQCGIGLADGINGVIDGNKVINSNPVVGGGNTAIYVWKQYAPPCGPSTVTNNIATALKLDGTESSYWNGGGCDPVTFTGNVLDAAARTLLTPVSQKLPPPLIPPLPYNCVVRSPFSTQTGWPRCK